MSLDHSVNDLSHVIEADRAHVWHHLSQHKVYETVDPRVFVEGKGLKLWDAKGKEYLDAVSGGRAPVFVDSVFTAGDARQALRRVETGRARGAVVVVSREGDVPVPGRLGIVPDPLALRG